MPTCACACACQHASTAPPAWLDTPTLLDVLAPNTNACHPYSSPRPLQIDFFQQWQADLGVAYSAAQAAGFDGDSVAEVERVTDRMTETWWHVGQLKPSFLCYLAHKALPANSSQLPLWREIAGEVLPQLDEASRAIVVSASRSSSSSRCCCPC